MLRIIIPFHQLAPSLEEIQRAFAARTGLELTVMMVGSDGSAWLRNPEFECEPVIMRAGDEIHIIVDLNEASYILWALLSALISLGGEYPEELPAYADKRWDSLTELHDTIRDLTID